jgi:ribonucleoside-diphosphate reductase alpha chain
VEDVKTAYTEAYKTGCKGITVYRDGSREHQVLTVKKDEDKSQKTVVVQPALLDVPPHPEPSARPVLSVQDG